MLKGPTMLTPREYQESGIKWAIAKKKCMIADEPGLGKSYQATEVLYRANAFPALIFCPSHLVEQWALFIQDQYPLNTVSYAKKADSYIRDWALQKKADFYICNLEMLRNPDFFAWPQNVKALVFDESHHLKNRESKQSLGALHLVFQFKPEFVLCLSATPIKREADDLFAQLRLLRPDIFTSYATFCKNFCETEFIPWGSKLRVLGIKDKSGLMKLLEVVMLRREYKEVSMQLPELIESTITIEFDAAQRKAYDTLKNNLILEIEGMESVPYMWAIQAINMLRRMTATQDKIQACVDLALDAPKPVVFTHFKNTARAIAEKLKVPCITGDIPAFHRADIAKAQPMIVATIDSLTEGVDLSHMDTVIFAEEDYTPGSNDQALKRVYRYGARLDQPIIKYCVHVENSIDERIHERAFKRQESATGLLSAVLDLNSKQLQEII